MFEPFTAIEQTDEFRDWLETLRDTKGRGIILDRIQRFREHGLGDIKNVGEGVWELRIDFGPGYRVYWLPRADLILLLLAGGDKSTQKRDIMAAQRLAGQLDDDS